MAELTVGQEIRIACEAKPGPFADERLVTIPCIGGTVCGFMNREHVKYGDDGNGSVRATVRKVEPDRVEAWLQGDFFTTNGIVKVYRDAVVAA